MILALDRSNLLSVFASTAAAETAIEAIDVQQECVEFCDEHSVRFVPEFTVPPKISKIWIFGSVEIGAFKLVRQNGRENDLVVQFLSRAEACGNLLERSDFEAIRSIEDLRDAIVR